MHTIRKRIRKLTRVLAAALLGSALLLLAGWFALHLVPLPPALFTNPAPEFELLDRHGQPLRAVRPDEGPFHQVVSYSELPAPLLRATLAAEDARFWQHPGVDWRASLRAGWQLLRHRRVISGGSTVTQQLIKLARPRPRTFGSKIIEALQALRLEQVWDKQRILAAYLNRVEYGNFNRGCAAAAQYYFAKSLRDLSPAECAFLAGLPQAPSRLNPRTHLDRALKRQQWVLSQMRRQGWLSEEDFRRGLAEPLQLSPSRRIFEAPHFVEMALRSLQGAPVTQARTTLDLELNRFVDSSLRQHLARLREQHVSNGAVVVLDTHTGEVLALVGSGDYFERAGGQVNGAWAPRSAGSTFKPFTYLLALERGATPATVVADVPTDFATATGLFTPANYNHHCYGPMRYRLALANSLNISAVKVLASIGGPEPLQRLLQRCGLTTLNRPSDEYGLGLTIGNAEARLLELANAYACLARLGEYQPYRLLLNPRPPSATQPPGRVADPAAAYLIADILSDNAARTLAFGAESPLRFDFPVACKTGTSSDFRDNWAFGYTPEFTVSIWVGNFDGSPMQNVSGVTGAAPLLHEIVEHLHSRYGSSWYPMPTNIVECPISPLSGKRLNGTALGRDAVVEKFIAANLPPLESGLDPSARPLELGSEYRDWLASSDNWLGSSAVIAETTDSVRILFPPPGTRLYLDTDLPQAGRRLHLRALGPPDLEWESDSLELTREGDAPVALLTEGTHKLTVRIPRTGAQAQTWVEVVKR